MAKSRMNPTPIDRTFRDACDAAGVRCRLLWTQSNPGASAVPWLECYQVGNSIALVQSFDGGGWEVFTPCASRDVAETIADAFNRCGVKAEG